MIYRIVPFNRGDNKATYDFWDFTCEWMDASKLRSPKKWGNRKAHFWFTEKGWQEIGKPMTVRTFLKIMVKRMDWKTI